MAILTQEMLERHVGERELARLTDDAHSSPDEWATDEAVLARIIADGEGEILGLIGQRYTLPLSLSKPQSRDLVTAKLMDVVRFRLYLHRDGQAKSDDDRMLYKGAIAWAEKVAAGTIGLDGETPLESSPALGGGITFVGESAVIDRDTTRRL